METDEQKAAREAEELRAKEAAELAAKAGEGVKTPEEEAAAVAARAEKLLADGTPANKNIVVSKQRFDDKNEKSKLYETHAVLLDKVLENPSLVEKLLETEAKGNLESRLADLEAERKAAKRREMQSALQEAIAQFPDFERDWADVSPIVDSLVTKGYSYRESLSRAYVAVHPEAAALERTRMATEAQNRDGKLHGTSLPPRTNEFKKSVPISEDDARVAKALGKTPEEYAKLLDTHRDWLRKNFGEAEEV